MEKLLRTLLLLSVLSLALALITKFTYGLVTKPGMIAGVGPSGYLSAAVVILLIGANLALLELLKKK